MTGKTARPPPFLETFHPVRGKRRGEKHIKNWAPADVLNPGSVGFAVGLVAAFSTPVPTLQSVPFFMRAGTRRACLSPSTLCPPLPQPAVELAKLRLSSVWRTWVGPGPAPSRPPCTCRWPWCAARPISLQPPGARGRTASPTWRNADMSLLSRSDGDRQQVAEMARLVREGCPRRRVESR